MHQHQHPQDPAEGVHPAGSVPEQQDQLRAVRVPGCRGVDRGAAAASRDAASFGERDHGRADNTSAGDQSRGACRRGEESRGGANRAEAAGVQRLAGAENRRSEISRRHRGQFLEGQQGRPAARQFVHHVRTGYERDSKRRARPATQEAPDLREHGERFGLPQQRVLRSAAERRHLRLPESPSQADEP